jgi:hypothetical protein
MKKQIISSIVLGLCAAGAANAVTPAHYVKPTHMITPTHYVKPTHIVLPHFGSDTVTALCAKNGFKANCKVYVNCTGKEVIVHANGWVNDITLNPRQVAIDSSTTQSLNIYNTQRQLLATLAVQASDSQTNSLYALASKYVVAHRDESTQCGL